MLVDIHCHLDFSQFDKDREEVIRRSLKGGVWMINVGTDFRTSKASLSLAEKYNKIFASVGLHPLYVLDEKRGGGFDFRAYQNLARHPKVVAIGECGLDYWRLGEGKEEQKEAFKKQIELALELDKPLMIHCRKAHQDVFDILSFYFQSFLNKLKVNIHFFSGDWEIAKKYLDMGFYLSFTGVITFAKDYGGLIKKIPLERMMIETDSPFVAPLPYRGKRCEPLFVKEVAKKIAEIKGIDFKEVEKVTFRNSVEFFNLS